MPIPMQNDNGLQQNEQTSYVADHMVQKILALEGCLLDTKEVG